MWAIVYQMPTKRDSIIVNSILICPGMRFNRNSEKKTGIFGILRKLLLTQAALMTKTLTAAEQAGWIGLPWYYYDAAVGGYQLCGFDPWAADDRLRPWRGYWVVAGPATVRLRIPAP